MFGDLYAIVRHTPLHLSMTPNGEQLCIIVTPLPKGKAAEEPALKAPLKIVGTPAELEAQFPTEIARYTQAVNEVRAKFDLPLDALAAAKKKAATKDAARAEKEKKKEAEKEARSEAAKKAARTRAKRAEEQRKARERNAAEKKRAREASAQKRRDAAAARKAKKTAGKITLPGATSAPKTKAAPQIEGTSGKGLPDAGRSERADAALSRDRPAAAAAPAARHLASKPGKAECIADWVRLNEQFGANLTRRKFIKLAKTSRRYEKLWKNWEAFIVEARGGAAEHDDARIPEQGTVVKQSPGLPFEWPFPTSSKAPEGAIHTPPDSGAVRGQSPETLPPSSSPRAEPAAPEPEQVARYEVRDDVTGALLALVRKRPQLGDALALGADDVRSPTLPEGALLIVVSAEAGTHRYTATLRFRETPATEGATA